VANAVVTSDATKVKVVFNDMANVANRSTSYFKRDDIIEVYSDSTNCYVTVVLAHNQNFDVSLDGCSGTMIVDSVDAVVPTDNADLRDKLGDLIT